MLTDSEIESAATRLSSGKLTDDDVDSMVSAFRLVLGSLEVTNNYSLVAKLESLDDTLDNRKKAAKIAAIIIRLQNEDFGVSDLTGELQNSDDHQRRLFIVYAFSILYTVPAELAYYDNQVRALLLSRRTSSSIPVTFVP